MKSKQRGCLLPVLVLALVILLGGLWLNHRGAGLLWSAWQSVSHWAQTENADFRVSVRSGDMTLSADGWWTEDTDGRIYGLTAQTLPLYVQGNTLALDNGRAYALPALPELEAVIPELLLGALLEGQITTQNETTRLALPDKHLAVTISAPEGQLTRLEVETLFALEETDVPITVSIVPTPAQPHTISAEIQQALTSENPMPLLEPLEPLMPAVQDLAERETVSGDLNITVDCGVLTIDETLGLEYTTADGVLHLRRGGLHVPVEIPELEMLLSPAAVPLVLLRNGEFVKTDNGCQWNIDVEPALSKALFQALIPELGQLDLDFVPLDAQICVSDARFRTVTLSGSGEIPFLVTTIPITVTMTLMLS